MIVCPRCDNACNATARFCEHCGVRLSDPPATLGHAAGAVGRALAGVMLGVVALLMGAFGACLLLINTGSHFYLPLAMRGTVLIGLAALCLVSMVRLLKER